MAPRLPAAATALTHTTSSAAVTRRDMRPRTGSPTLRADG